MMRRLEACGLRSSSSGLKGAPKGSSAVMMGVADEVGTVEAGKAADIIAVKGDVLKHINLLGNVDLVMKAGTVYKQDGQPIEARL